MSFEKDFSSVDAEELLAQVTCSSSECSKACNGATGNGSQKVFNPSC